MSKQFYFEQISTELFTFNVKKIIFKKNQFIMNKQFKCQKSSILNNLVEHQYAVYFYLTHG